MNHTEFHISVTLKLKNSILEFSLYFYSSIFNLHFHTQLAIEKHLFLRIIFYMLLLDRHLFPIYFLFHHYIITCLLSQIILTSYFLSSLLTPYPLSSSILLSNGTKGETHLSKLSPIHSLYFSPVLWQPLPNDVPAPALAPFILFSTHQTG